MHLGSSRTLCSWDITDYVQMEWWGRADTHIASFFFYSLFHQTSLTKHKFKDKIPRWWQACILSHWVMSDSLWSMDYSPPGSFCPWDSSGKKHWSGLPFSSPGDLPNPRIEPEFPALQASEPGKPTKEDGDSRALYQAQGPSELWGLNKGTVRTPLKPVLPIWCFMEIFVNKCTNESH